MPCSVLVPFIALVFGVYPLVLNRQFALAATLYYTSSTLVTMVSSSSGRSGGAACRVGGSRAAAGSCGRAGNKVHCVFWLCMHVRQPTCDTSPC